MSYVPPHLRKGFVAKPVEALPKEEETIGYVLKDLGWTRSGGNYYYPEKHPHIHIILNGSSKYDGKANIYASATMVAISTGAGGGGLTYVRDGAKLVIDKDTSATKVALLEADARLVFEKVMAAF